MCSIDFLNLDISNIYSSNTNTCSMHHLGGLNGLCGSTWRQHLFTQSQIYYGLDPYTEAEVESFNQREIK